MNPIAYTIQRLALASKRRKLAKLNDWIAQLHDQVDSGQQALRYWNAKRERLEAQILCLEAPDEIVRRAA